MPVPFEGLFQEATQYYKPPVDNAVTPSFDSLNSNLFRSSINQIPTMDEGSLALLIKNCIDTISKDILENNIDYVYLFTNPKFVSALNRALCSIPISYEIRLAYNKIVYDYFTSDQPNQEIKKMYLNTSKVINHEAINKLMAVGLNETIACNLALCRYSSANERTNAKRLNFAIYNRDPTIMTEQMIVWIYEKLFTRIYDLFSAIMFEVYPIEQQSEFGENFMEVYGTVDLVILLILNNMTSDNIRKVLIGYSEEWEYKGRPPVRFSMHCLSEDNYRIKRVLESLDRIVP